MYLYRVYCIWCVIWDNILTVKKYTVSCIVTVGAVLEKQLLVLSGYRRAYGHKGTLTLISIIHVQSPEKFPCFFPSLRSKLWGPFRVHRPVQRSLSPVSIVYVLDDRRVLCAFFVTNLLHYSSLEVL